MIGLMQLLHRFPIPIWKERELSKYLHAGEAVGLKSASEICTLAHCLARHKLPSENRVVVGPAEFVTCTAVFKTDARKPRGY